VSEAPQSPTTLLDKLKVYLLNLVKDDDDF